MTRTRKQFPLSVRNLIQLGVLFVTAAIGLQFYIFVNQASGIAAVTVSRPPGVEGFLPIGALMNWKRFALTGSWDVVHPAAMVIFGFAVLLSFVLRKTFCSWFCPVGTVSEWCWRLGNLLIGKRFRMPSILDVPMRTAKYLLLGFFIWSVSTMNSDQILSFVGSPYYKLADVKMLFFFTRMTLLTAGVLSGLFVLSLFFNNFWCRYLCPYGALLGLVSWISPSRIRRNKRECALCGKCEEVCPSFVQVPRKQSIQSPECTGCMNCVLACPKEEVLSLETIGLRKQFWNPRRVAVFITLLFVIMVYSASITGHWKSSVSEHEFRMRLRSIDAPGNTHPRIRF